MDIFSYFQKKGIDTVDRSFYRMIALWESWYKGKVRNFTFYRIYSGKGTYSRKKRKSLGMAKKLSEDIADLLLNERVQITLSDEATGNFVEEILHIPELLHTFHICMMQQRQMTDTLFREPARSELIM